MDFYLYADRHVYSRMVVPRVKFIHHHHANLVVCQRRLQVLCRCSIALDSTVSVHK